MHSNPGGFLGAGIDGLWKPLHEKLAVFAARINLNVDKGGIVDDLSLRQHR